MKKHSHYHKDVSGLATIDVYRVCDLFGVQDPSGATQHAIKKLLLPGQRGGKSMRQDLQEAVDSLNRRIQMLDEDAKADQQQAVHIDLSAYSCSAESFAAALRKSGVAVGRAFEPAAEIDDDNPRNLPIHQGGELAEHVYPAVDAMRTANGLCRYCGEAEGRAHLSWCQHAVTASAVGVEYVSGSIERHPETPRHHCGACGLNHALHQCTGGQMEGKP